MTKETNLYEIGYLLKADLAEEEILSFSEKLRDAITKNSGLVVSEGKIQKKELAYPIKKEINALFNWLTFSTTDKAILTEIKKHLENQPEVLRFLTIKTTEEQQKPISFKKRPSAKKIEEVTKEITEAAGETSEAPKEEAENKNKVKEEEIDAKIEELLGEE